MSGRHANQIWLVLLALVSALTAALLIRTLLLQVNRQVLTSLVPSLGAEPAILLAALLECVVVLGFMGALASVLEQTLAPGQDWRWLPRIAGLVGLLVIFVSLANLSALDKFGRAQLLVTLVWSLFAFWLSRGAGPFSMRLPTPWVVPVGRLPELLAMAQHLILGGLLVGLTAFALGISNFLKMMARISPELSEQVYLHGFKVGLLLAILLTPATRDVRTPLAIGFLVDWLGGLFLPAPVVPIVQFVSVVAATLATQQPFRTAWSLSVGMCAGRVLGRVLGYLLVGAEGVALLEPLMEVTLGVLMTAETPASSPHPSPEAA